MHVKCVVNIWLYTVNVFWHFLSPSLHYFSPGFSPPQNALDYEILAPWTRTTQKAMAPHSSTLAWKILWTEEPGGLQSVGSLRVGHDWTTSHSLFTFMHWRRKWQPTPVFLPGDSQGRGVSWAAVYGVAQSRTWLKWLSSSKWEENLRKKSGYMYTYSWFTLLYSKKLT